MIELYRISAGYGRKTVLKEVSAAFEKGKLTVIIGVNGCGKSTLLKTMLGIVPTSSGDITIDCPQDRLSFPGEKHSGNDGGAACASRQISALKLSKKICKTGL